MSVWWFGKNGLMWKYNDPSYTEGNYVGRFDIFFYAVQDYIDEINDQLCKTEEDVKQLRARIAELEAERRWIPVSERLPENGNVVLAFGEFIDFLSYFDGDWHVMFDEDWTVCHFVNYPSITHWMPLPTPPEDE